MKVKTLTLAAGITVAAATGAFAGICPDGTEAVTAVGCPQPVPIVGKVTSTKRFQDECAWLIFPVGTVGKPVVFFTRDEDARCVGANWRVDCPDCTEWIQPDRPRGPVYGPASRAVVALRLHDGMTGVSVPRDAFNRIAKEAGWCDLGITAPDQSHGFDEKPW